MKERVSAYAAAGVDTEAGDRAVELMKAAVGRTLGADVVGGVGGFAGMVDASALREFQRPLLATSTDGVGTKIAIARALDVHDTIGQDLVGMVVDDIAVVGARPLLMTGLHRLRARRPRADRRRRARRRAGVRVRGRPSSGRRDGGAPRPHGA